MWMAGALLGNSNSVEHIPELFIYDLFNNAVSNSSTVTNVRTKKKLRGL
jgi:hypothetical protein